MPRIQCVHCARRITLLRDIARVRCPFCNRESPAEPPEKTTPPDPDVAELLARLKAIAERLKSAPPAPVVIESPAPPPETPMPAPSRSFGGFTTVLNICVYALFVVGAGVGARTLATRWYPSPSSGVFHAAEEQEMRAPRSKKAPIAVPKSLPD